MATDPKKRQKQLAKKTAKRKEKRHLVVRDKSAGEMARAIAAAKYPILHCLISDSIKTQGMGWVILSREMPSGSIAVALFLVDSYCLGVKDAFARVVPRSVYDQQYLRKMRDQSPSQPIAPADARKFLKDAVDYAFCLGLSCHPDYLKAVQLFGDVNAADSAATFEFGKNGKPFFISGPNDTPERCRQIVAILGNALPADGFDYQISISAGSNNLRNLSDLEQGDLAGIDDGEDFLDDEPD